MASEGQLNALLSSLVYVAGLPASRAVVALERTSAGVWQVCGSGMSSESGEAAVNILGDPASAVYAVALDEWGSAWAPALSVSAGDTIRPTDFDGFLFRVTSAGVLPDIEPVWWTTATEGPQPLGSAMVEAVRYYQPIAHGPLILSYEEKDPYWANVVSLLHFDVAGTSSTPDETGRVWAFTGNAQLDTAQSKFGGASSFFGGASDSLATPHSGDLNFGSGDFTLELQFRSAERLQSGTRQMALLAKWGDSTQSIKFSFLIDYYNGALRFVASRDGSSTSPILVSAPYVIDAGVWMHLAVVRRAGTLMFFIDGKLSASASVAVIGTSTSPMIVGNKSDGNGTSFFSGHIDELRITKGVARYTDNFIPPAEPFLNL